MNTTTCDGCDKLVDTDDLAFTGEDVAGVATPVMCNGCQNEWEAQ